MQNIRRRGFFQFDGDKLNEVYWLCYGEYTGKKEIDVFKRYVDARLKMMYREDAYRLIVSETLKLSPQGKTLKISYKDVINIKKPEKKKTGKEVAEEAARRMGVKINWGGGKR